MQTDGGGGVKEGKKEAPEKRASGAPACLESAGGASQSVLCVSHSLIREYALSPRITLS